MKNVTLIGRYRVYKHSRRWIVTAPHAHGEGCISKHGSHATACAAAKRYDESDRRADDRYNKLIRKFVGDGQ
jgi:hypothetical protein